jgi:putative ABC transport system permease protein
MGTTEQYVEINFATMVAGRSFTQQEVQRARKVAVIGYGPYEALFQKRGIDPIGKPVRVGAANTGDRRRGQASLAGRLRRSDDFAIVPYTAFRKQFGSEKTSRGPFRLPVMVVVLPKEGVSREDAMRDVEAIMRIRHGLTLDKENDFDISHLGRDPAGVGSDLAAILLALVVISSIALMVGGIGVMAIMTISVTERTREIRRAQGDRRAPPRDPRAVPDRSRGAHQRGRTAGRADGQRHRAAGKRHLWLPGLAAVVVLCARAWIFGSIGIFFGMLPAWRASRLDPIEALRYE